MPTWDQVALVALSPEWQFIPLTEPLTLRIQQSNPPQVVRYTPYLYVARALLVGSTWQFHRSRRVYLDGTAIVLDYPDQPPEMAGSILAIKGSRYNRQVIQLKIEVSDGGYDDPELPLVQCIDSVLPSFGEDFE
jgi:hypothetical protein